MKTTRLFAITMTAAALLSCSKEEVPDAGKDAGRSKLTLKIMGEKQVPEGRSAGTPTQTEESTINDFMIFIFKADGTNDIAPREYTTLPAEGKVSDLEITTDAKEVYVIANTANNTAVQDALKAVTKKSDLQAVVGRGFTGISKTSPATQSKTNLWMSGKNDAAFTPVKDGNVTTSVTLKYVAAKLRITSVTVDPSVTLTLTDVVVFNGAGATRLIPADGNTSLIPSFTAAVSAPFYVSGIAMAGMANKPTISSVNNEYNYTLTNDLTISAGKNQHYFYVFENDGAASTFEGQPTILTLKAVDQESNEVCYSVLFKADADGSLGYDNQIIERGNSYDVAMTIKKLGNSDPTVPALKTTVEVNITPASWQTVTIDKVYE